MKNILFTTTALIATASVAAAEINFSGYGRFGASYKQDRTETVTTITGTANTKTGEITIASSDEDVERPDTIFVSRFRLNIDASTETDSGTKFSARVRLQGDENSDDGEANQATLNGPQFSVENSGLRVNVGNVAGALDNLSNYYGIEPGLENFIGQYSGVDYSFLGYSSTGAGANAVYIAYRFGNLKLAAAYDQKKNEDNEDADQWDVNTAYTFDNITAAIGYGENDGNESLTVLTLRGEWGDFKGILFVADDDVSAEDKNGTAYGLSAAYKVGAATALTFAYGDGSGDNDKQQYGLGFTHGLGGGTSLNGGVGRSKVGDGAGVTQADFGVQFDF